MWLRRLRRIPLQQKGVVIGSFVVPSMLFRIGIRVHDALLITQARVLANIFCPELIKAIISQEEVVQNRASPHGVVDFCHIFLDISIMILNRVCQNPESHLHYAKTAFDILTNLLIICKHSKTALTKLNLRTLSIWQLNNVLSSLLDCLKPHTMCLQ
jgi:hypothetical protein